MRWVIIIVASRGVGCSIVFEVDIGFPCWVIENR